MIPVNEPLLDGREKELLVDCIESGWVSSDGPYVARFEELVADRVQRAHGVAVTNGTSALDVAVEALDIGEGDEVIMPTFAIISCALQIVRSGAVPVLVDCDPDTWNMDVREIEALVTDRTRAILVVHTYGLPVDMDPVLDIAARYGLRVIEDAAEVLGQSYRGAPCGSFGDVSTFSFYPNKHVTTGEGGMVLTNDAGIAETARSLRNLCFQPQRRFVHDRLGWNLRMSNLQAAVGVAQIERLDEFVARKQRMGARYTRMLAGVPQIRGPLTRTPYAENVYWVYGVVLDDDVAFDAREAMRRLAARGVGSRPFFFPLHQQPVFTKHGLFGGQRFPVAERLASRGFYLPSGLALTDDQQQAVVDAVREIVA